MGTFFPNSTPAMTEELQAKITELEEKNNSLIKSIEHHQYVNRQHETQVDQFMQYLFDYLGNGDIDEDVAEEMAGCFGRTLSRTVNVNFSMQGTMELTIPFGVEIDDLSNEFDILIQPSYASDVVMEWDDIHSIEIEEA